MMGNRGIIHDPSTRTLLKRRWTTRAWIICVCDFKGARREVMERRSWTELFFLDEATALQGAGCFAVVLEAMPAIVAARISEALDIPTIGIGAGADCDGQILVWHDLLGLTPGHVPQFVKRYAELGVSAKAALEAYVRDVRSGSFPEPQHTYDMADGEAEIFKAAALKGGDESR